jgi:hypothetical protein
MHRLDAGHALVLLRLVKTSALVVGLVKKKLSADFTSELERKQ